MSIWVCGEVLIDLLPGNPERLAVVGGGPANTAKALARLGHDVEFIDGISTDAYGKSARAELLRDGVGLDLALTSDLPTCTATVSLIADGSASYEFLINGTATFAFDNSWLPDPERYKPEVLQIGTLVTIIEPGASVLYDWAVKVSEFAPIVFDPNIRPSVMPDLFKYRNEVEKWLKISSVVKFSCRYRRCWRYRRGNNCRGDYTDWYFELKWFKVKRSFTSCCSCSCDNLFSCRGATTPCV